MQVRFRFMPCRDPESGIANMQAALSTSASEQVAPDVVDWREVARTETPNTTLAVAYEAAWSLAGTPLAPATTYHLHLRCANPAGTVTYSQTPVLADPSAPIVSGLHGGMHADAPETCVASLRQVALQWNCTDAESGIARALVYVATRDPVGMVRADLVDGLDVATATTFNFGDLVPQPAGAPALVNGQRIYARVRCENGAGLSALSAPLVLTLDDMTPPVVALTALNPTAPADTPVIPQASQTNDTTLCFRLAIARGLGCAPATAGSAFDVVTYAEDGTVTVVDDEVPFGEGVVEAAWAGTPQRVCHEVAGGLVRNVTYHVRATIARGRPLASLTASTAGITLRTIDPPALDVLLSDRLGTVLVQYELRTSLPEAYGLTRVELAMSTSPTGPVNMTEWRDVTAQFNLGHLIYTDSLARAAWDERAAGSTAWYPRMRVCFAGGEAVELGAGPARGFGEDHEGVVLVGNGPALTHRFYQSSATEVRAAWHHFRHAPADLRNYHVWVGTSPGGMEIYQLNGTRRTWIVLASLALRNNGTTRKGNAPGSVPGEYFFLKNIFVVIDCLLQNRHLPGFPLFQIPRSETYFVTVSAVYADNAILQSTSQPFRLTDLPTVLAYTATIPAYLTSSQLHLPAFEATPPAPPCEPLAGRLVPGQRIYATLCTYQQDLDEWACVQMDNSTLYDPTAPVISALRVYSVDDSALRVAGVAAEEARVTWAHDDPLNEINGTLTGLTHVYLTVSATNAAQLTATQTVTLSVVAPTRADLTPVAPTLRLLDPSEPRRPATAGAVLEWSSAPDHAAVIARYEFVLFDNTTGSAVLNVTQDGWTPARTNVPVPPAVRLEDGHQYLVRARAVDILGRVTDWVESQTAPWADASAPVVASFLVGVPGTLDGARYIGDAWTVNVSWVMTEPDGPLATISLALGTTQGSTDLLPFTILDGAALTGAQTLSLPVPLRHRQVVHPTVIVTNLRRAISTTVNLAPLLVDLTPAPAPRLADLHASRAQVWARVEISPDLESRVLRVEAGIGRSATDPDVAPYRPVASVVETGADFVNVTLADLNLTMTTLAPASPYYLLLRVTNGARLARTTATAFLVDTASPAPPARVWLDQPGDDCVNLGPVGDRTPALDLVTLTAHWSACLDAESPIARYELALGDSVAHTAYLPWTDIGTPDVNWYLLYNVGLTGLSPLPNATASVYLSVRCVDAAGLASPATRSVAPVIAVRPAVSFHTAGLAADYEIGQERSLRVRWTDPLVNECRLSPEATAWLTDDETCGDQDGMMMMTRHVIRLPFLAGAGGRAVAPMEIVLALSDQESGKRYLCLFLHSPSPRAQLYRTGPLSLPASQPTPGRVTSIHAQYTNASRAVCALTVAWGGFGNEVATGLQGYEIWVSGLRQAARELAAVVLSRTDLPPMTTNGTRSHTMLLANVDPSALLHVTVRALAEGQSIQYATPYADPVRCGLPALAAPFLALEGPVASSVDTASLADNALRAYQVDPQANITLVFGPAGCDQALPGRTSDQGNWAREAGADLRVAIDRFEWSLRMANQSQTPWAILGRAGPRDVTPAVDEVDAMAGVDLVQRQVWAHEAFAPGAASQVCVRAVGVEGVVSPARCVEVVTADTPVTCALQLPVYQRNATALLVTWSNCTPSQTPTTRAQLCLTTSGGLLLAPCRPVDLSIQSAVISGLNLTDREVVHVELRTWNVVGAEAASQGQVVMDLSPPDLGRIDWAAPAIQWAGMAYQDEIATTSVTITGFADTGSSISHYLLALGTAPGASDVSPWWDVTSQLPTITNITIPEAYPDNATLYATVRCYDAVGWYSEARSMPIIPTATPPKVTLNDGRTWANGTVLFRDPHFVPRVETTVNCTQFTETNCTNVTQTLCANTTVLNCTVLPCVNVTITECANVTQPECHNVTRQNCTSTERVLQATRDVLLQRHTDSITVELVQSFAASATVAPAAPLSTVAWALSLNGTVLSAGQAAVPQDWTGLQVPLRITTSVPECLWSALCLTGITASGRNASEPLCRELFACPHPPAFAGSVQLWRGVPDAALNATEHQGPLIEARWTSWMQEDPARLAKPVGPLVSPLATLLERADAFVGQTMMMAGPLEDTPATAWAWNSTAPSMPLAAVRAILVADRDAGQLTNYTARAARAADLEARRTAMDTCMNARASAYAEAQMGAGVTVVVEPRSEAYTAWLAEVIGACAVGQEVLLPMGQVPLPRDVMTDAVQQLVFTYLRADLVPVAGTLYRTVIAMTNHLGVTRFVVSGGQLALDAPMSVVPVDPSVLVTYQTRHATAAARAAFTEELDVGVWNGTADTPSGLSLAALDNGNLLPDQPAHLHLDGLLVRRGLAGQAYYGQDHIVAMVRVAGEVDWESVDTNPLPPRFALTATRVGAAPGPADLSARFPASEWCAALANQAATSPVNVSVVRAGSSPVSRVEIGLGFGLTEPDLVPWTDATLALGAVTCPLLTGEHLVAVNISLVGLVDLGMPLRVMMRLSDRAAGRVVLASDPVLIDLSPPLAGVVFFGNETFRHPQWYHGHTSQLCLRWSSSLGFSDPDSGILGYELAAALYPNAYPDPYNQTHSPVDGRDVLREAIEGWVQDERAGLAPQPRNGFEMAVGWAKAPGWAGQGDVVPESVDTWCVPYQWAHNTTVYGMIRVTNRVGLTAIVYTAEPSRQDLATPVPGPAAYAHFGFSPTSPVIRQSELNWLAMTWGGFARPLSPYREVRYAIYQRDGAKLLEIQPPTRLGPDATVIRTDPTLWNVPALSPKATYVGCIVMFSQSSLATPPVCTPDLAIDGSVVVVNPDSDEDTVPFDTEATDPAVSPVVGSVYIPAGASTTPIVLETVPSRAATPPSPMPADSVAGTPTSADTTPFLFANYSFVMTVRDPAATSVANGGAFEFGRPVTVRLQFSNLTRPDFMPFLIMATPDGAGWMDAAASCPVPRHNWNPTTQFMIVDVCRPGTFAVLLPRYNVTFAPLFHVEEHECVAGLPHWLPYPEDASLLHVTWHDDPAGRDPLSPADQPLSCARQYERNYTLTTFFGVPALERGFLHQTIRVTDTVAPTPAGYPESMNETIVMYCDAGDYDTRFESTLPGLVDCQEGEGRTRFAWKYYPIDPPTRCPRHAYLEYTLWDRCGNSRTVRRAVYHPPRPNATAAVLGSVFPALAWVAMLVLGPWGLVKARRWYMRRRRERLSLIGEKFGAPELVDSHPELLEQLNALADRMDQAKSLLAQVPADDKPASAATGADQPATSAPAPSRAELARRFDLAQKRLMGTAPQVGEERSGLLAGQEQAAAVSSPLWSPAVLGDLSDSLKASLGSPAASPAPSGPSPVVLPGGGLMNVPPPPPPALPVVRQSQDWAAGLLAPSTQLAMPQQQQQQQQQGVSEVAANVPPPPLPDFLLPDAAAASLPPPPAPRGPHA
ncbi:hypothetical protein PAPYR_4589 [Paratrimastix pyriformis]|uniref:Uncharacterized protein n=1 Tax=Paratrimastix pyriformis TaxID=342808 RepID=A0ABQ8UQA8_9EUKA|nr:hypothetical protein PAPYR_4589 [Paratrimastix pyriformis]